MITPESGRRSRSHARPQRGRIIGHEFTQLQRWRISRLKGVRTRAPHIPEAILGITAEIILRRRLQIGHECRKGSRLNIQLSRLIPCARIRPAVIVTVVDRDNRRIISGVQNIACQLGRIRPHIRGGEHL